MKELRAITGLTQEAFGKKYGIPRRTIENWECNVSRPPAYVLELLKRAVMEDYPNKQ